MAIFHHHAMGDTHEGYSYGQALRASAPLQLNIVKLYQNSPLKAMDF